MLLREINELESILLTINTMSEGADSVYVKAAI